MVFLFLVIMRVVSNVLVVIQSPPYWLDIYVARMMRLGFAFGAFLDPVADELMVASTLILLCTKLMDAVVLGTSPWLVTIPSITIISYTSCQSRHSYIGCNQARKRSRSNRREKIWCSTKLDLMDKGTNALEVLEGRSYILPHPWVGIVNRS